MVRPRVPLRGTWVGKGALVVAGIRGSSGAEGHTAARVLVVDDNRDAADSLGELLGVMGHEVAVVYDGIAALERASSEPFDVVLCDLGLPGLDGYQVARALRERGVSSRLVAVSGYAQPEDLARSQEAGFDGHVVKPPDVERILDFLG
jgi:CheY-like chemotaxis protein